MISSHVKRLRSIRPRTLGAKLRIRHGHLSKQQWHNLPGDIASGWWLLSAEALAVVILLILAWVAGPKAASMASNLDTLALAAMARDNPRAMCINVSESLVGAKFPNITLSFGLEWTDNNSRSWTRNVHTFGGADSLWPWAYPRRPAPKEAYVMGQQALLAMWECGILYGAYNSDDILAHIEGNGTLARLESQTKQKIQNATRYNEDASENIKLRPMFNPPGTEFLPQRCGGYFEEFSQSSLSQSPEATVMLPTQWGPGTYFAALDDVTQPPQPNTNMLPGVLQLDAVKVRLPQNVSSSLRPYCASVWLLFAKQSNTTSRCMTQNAPMLVDFLIQSYGSTSVGLGTTGSDGSYTYKEWPLSQLLQRRGLMAGMWVNLAPVVEVNEVVSDRPGAVFPSVEWRLEDAPAPWSTVDALYARRTPYSCAKSIETSVADVAAQLTKLAAFKDAAKSTSTTTLFLSMRKSSVEDVYAVYTGILGALFGAFALLVATLFIYAAAIVKRMWCPKPKPEDAESAESV